MEIIIITIIDIWQICSGKSTLGRTFNSYKSKVPKLYNIIVGHVTCNMTHVPFSASFRGRKLWKIFMGPTSYPAAVLKEGTWKSLRQNPKEVSSQRSQYMECGENSDNPIQMMSKRHEIPARYVHHLYVITNYIKAQGLVTGLLDFDSLFLVRIATCGWYLSFVPGHTITKTAASQTAPFSSRWNLCFSKSTCFSSF